MTGLWQLAQVNLAQPRAALESVEMAGFVANLDRINALAEESPGFVWRLQDDSGNATAIQGPFAGDVIVNLSVWESVAALESFTYETMHRQFVDRRKEWFRPIGGRHLALWWVPAGTRPTVAEAADRLQLLADAGVTAEAFTIRRAFDPPERPPRSRSGNDPA